MRRTLALPLLALVLLGATWSFGHFDVRPEQLARNEQRWASLSGAERDVLRERWATLRQRLREGDAAAEVLLRRLGALNRMLQQPGPSALDGDELETHLERLPTRLQTYLGLARMHRKKGERDRALELLREAVRLYPADASVTESLAELEGARK